MKLNLRIIKEQIVFLTSGKLIDNDRYKKYVIETGEYVKKDS